MRFSVAILLGLLGASGAMQAAAEEPAKTPQQPSGRPRQLREKITVIPDLPYAETQNNRQRLDLLLPKQPLQDGPLPLVVFIHGGGWQKGDRRSGIGMLAPLVALGKYAGASIGYRLTNEAQWPSQIHDCKAAIRFLRANASRHGYDGDRIAVIGTSAGGHLVAMLGTSAGVPELEGSLGEFTNHSSRVSCVIDFFGPSDLATMGGWHNSPDSPEARLLGGAIPETKELARNASPIQYVTADDAPFLIIHGTNDQLVPFEQSVALQQKLSAAGVTALLIPIEGGGHGRFQNTELDERIVAFLENQLRGGKLPVATKPIPAAVLPER